MENTSEQSKTLELISQETGKDLANSKKLLEFWEKKAEVQQRPQNIGGFVGSGPVTFGGSGRAFFFMSGSRG